MIKLKFSIQGGDLLEGVLVYDESEHGLSFSAHSGELLSARLGSEGVTSVLIGTLQLEVDIESREVLFAWGYFPNIRGKVAAGLGAPDHFPGRVFISSDDSLQPGVSLEVPGEGWGVSYYPSSGWVAICLRDAVDVKFIQIASGIVLGIDVGDLVSVWLDPVFVSG